MASEGARRRVVVVGAGFGGLAVARALRNAPVAVTVVDRRNHHLFQRRIAPPRGRSAAPRPG